MYTTNIRVSSRYIRWVQATTQSTQIHPRSGDHILTPHYPKTSKPPSTQIRHKPQLKSNPPRQNTDTHVDLHTTNCQKPQIMLHLNPPYYPRSETPTQTPTYSKTRKKKPTKICNNSKPKQVPQGQNRQPHHPQSHSQIPQYLTHPLIQLPTNTTTINMASNNEDIMKQSCRTPTTVCGITKSKTRSGHKTTSGNNNGPNKPRRGSPNDPAH